jgi:hypothetical protein
MCRFAGQQVHGSIIAGSWRQDTNKASVFNATFQRSYPEGEEW